MLDTLLAKVVGTQNERELKRLRPLVAEVNGLEPAIKALADDQLRAKTAEFRQRITAGETLDDLLTEAFAVVREAGRRVLNMRHFDVQLIGGSVLHKGKIAEMKTGEGKTLVATLPAYLNALDGKGVHVVTVNDYLARRDSEWMGAAFRSGFLGVGTLGWSTLVQIVEASDDDRLAAIDTLARQLVAHFGAPSIEDAVAAAEEEFEFAASLCNHPLDTLVAMHRSHDSGEIREAFRTLRPKDGPKPLRAFAFLDVEGEDEPGDEVDLAGMAARERRDK